MGDAEDRVDELESEICNLEADLTTARAQVQFILTTHRLWDDDGKYQFPDGDVIEKEE